MSPTTTELASPTGHPAAPARRLAWMWTGVAVVVVAVVVMLGWRALASSALDTVVVGVSDHDCGDTAKVRARADGSLVVRTSEEMRCTFTVTVANQGDRSVDLGEVRAAVMGPETGSVLLAETIDGARPRGDDSTVDALHTLDRDLAGGSTATFDIVVVFHPQGCNYSGTLILDGFPRVEVSTLGAHRRIEAADDLAFDNSIRTPGCSRLSG